MKQKPVMPLGVQELCRKLKGQLEELDVHVEDPIPREEKARRVRLMEQLKEQLRELSQ